MKRQLKPETAHTLLKEKICTSTSIINLDEEDVRCISAGERIFLWESGSIPLEAIPAAAQQAAGEMTAEPGWEIGSAILKVTLGVDAGLENLEEISNPIWEILPEDAALLFGAEFCQETGVCFLLATSEKPRRKSEI